MVPSVSSHIIGLSKGCRQDISRQIGHGSLQSPQIRSSSWIIQTLSKMYIQTRINIKI